MEKITELQRLKELCEAGQGYIYNDFSPTGSQADMNVLHAASCAQLRKEKFTANLTYDKFYDSELYESIKWLLKERRANWKPCGSCRLLTSP